MMQNIIVVTNNKEQQDVVSYLKDSLKIMYHTDISISIAQTGLSRVDVIHDVNGTKNIAATHRVILVPVSMSIDSIRGFSPTANININYLLKRLDQMKVEAISFVNSQKKSLNHVSQQDALAKAAKNLFS
jgi:hypothetical protein